ncbi:MAG: hypothetical protein ACRCZF_25860, partial [Gemmataceae bacterium]
MSVRRRPALAGLVRLEDRTTPATFTASLDPGVDPTGAAAEIVGFMKAVNSNLDAADTINLFPNGNYSFSTPAESFDGGTALPTFLIKNSGDSLTINGNG